MPLPFAGGTLAGTYHEDNLGLEKAFIQPDHVVGIITFLFSSCVFGYPGEGVSLTTVVPFKWPVRATSWAQGEEVGEVSHCPKVPP